VRLLLNIKGSPAAFYLEFTPPSPGIAHLSVIIGNYHGLILYIKGSPAAFYLEFTPPSPGIAHLSVTIGNYHGAAS
jgi:hypothetical protein